MMMAPSTVLLALVNNQRFFHLTFGRAALECGRREFPLYHNPSIFVKSFLQKIFFYFFPKTP
jgi:hypothetical protein